MSATKALIVKDATYDAISQLVNERRKPHEKTEDFIINMLIDFYKNRSTILQEEIEEKDIVLSFPSPQSR